MLSPFNVPVTVRMKEAKVFVMVTANRAERCSAANGETEARQLAAGRLPSRHWLALTGAVGQSSLGRLSPAAHRTPANNSKLCDGANAKPLPQQWVLHGPATYTTQKGRQRTMQQPLCLIR